ncbi:uncharacterized protein [Spinacia oleracea]|uniref:Uncharacterized protein isoform X2 n=1 Tax=Spinacia oleracea TaxID=3562 RepID=A0ABM3QJ68_SPIOL|nr:uncharacterized protein LOC110787807 isoform X2 [Spinacia oleracea]
MFSIILVFMGLFGMNSVYSFSFCDSTHCQTATLMLSASVLLQELSELNQERAKKRISTYRGGRKGYVYYEEEIKQEVQVKDIPRNLVWIRANSIQEDGVITFDNPVDLEIAQAIKVLEAQQIRGEIDATGRNDILSRALKTPEHGGSVRGVGSGVTNKQYFGYNKPTPPSQMRRELNGVKSELATVKNTQTLLLNYLMSVGQVNQEQLKQFGFSNDNQVSHRSEKEGTIEQGLQGAHFQLASKQNKFQQQEVQTEMYHEPVNEYLHDPNQLNTTDQGIQGAHFQLASKHKKVQDREIQVEPYHVSWPEPEKGNVAEDEYIFCNEQVKSDHPFPQGVDSFCSLAIENDQGVQIVAIGTVYVVKEGEVVKNHFKPVPSGHYRVCIKEDINSSAPLPCPEGETKYVCQGRNRFFIWPAHLVFPIKKADKKVTEEFTTPSPRSPSSQSSSTRRYTITPEDRLKLTSSLINVFKDVAIGMKKRGEVKSFIIPARVFQNEQSINLDYEDMLDWCFQREIRSSHFSILMMHLSEMVQAQGISGLYGLCDCKYLSQLTYVKKEDDRCDYLPRVFACNDGKNVKQIFFVPYIEDQEWMLVVICPWVALVQWLDPSGAQTEPPRFAQTIINSKVHRKDITKIKTNPFIMWKQIECPRQPLGSKDSGYYVCRFMIETIESRHMIIPDKYFNKAPPTYSQKLINKLRETWISYVTGYYQPNNDEDDDDLYL